MTNKAYTKTFTTTQKIKFDNYLKIWVEADWLRSVSKVFRSKNFKAFLVEIYLVF